ncbi:MAG: trypsin-like serine protease [Planctomycetota bacterium]
MPHRQPIGRIAQSQANRPAVSSALSLTITGLLVTTQAFTTHAQNDGPRFTPFQWRTQVVPTLDLGDAETLNLQISNRLVTATGPATPGVNAGSPTVPGSPSFDLNTDGVARLFLDTDPAAGFGSICTASLLSTGQHLLTAAHCVTDDNGQPAILDGLDGNSATFELPNGTGSVAFTADDITVHPNWNGNETDGFDIAVIDLGTPVIEDIPRYELFTSNDASDFDVPLVKVGYGTSGDGSTGTTINAGTKRAGQNRYESFGFGFLGATNLDTQLLYDFDNGETANDAFGSLFGSAGLLAQSPLFDDALGFGSEEVGSAPGDSGGPSFLFNEQAQAWQIAGVTSYGIIFGADPDGPGPQAVFSPDATAALDSSFGEFAGDARVAQADIAAFIADAIAITTGLAGDFDASGQVEQGDLNLVLTNWASLRDFTDNVTAFASDVVDQEELNAVLNNWGSLAAPSFEGFAIPEPATGAAVVGLLGLGTRTLRRRVA